MAPENSITLLSSMPNAVTDYVPLAIAGLSLAVSGALGFLSRRTANRALALAERQEARRHSRLDLYLIASAARRRSSTGDRVLEFHVLVSNPADSASSLIAAELHVRYGLAEGVVTTVKIQHGLAGNDDLTTTSVTSLGLPARLDANDAVSGWLRFALPGSLLRGRAIDRYDLVVRDVHGIDESLQVSCLSETVDA